MAKKIDIEKLASKIDKDEFESYYKEHSISDCIEKFNLISYHVFHKFIDYLGIKKSTEERVKQRKRTLEERWGSLENYYNYHNHKTHETNSKKSKEVIVQQIEKQKRTNLKNFGVEFPAQSKKVLETRKENIIKKYGSYEQYYNDIFNKVKETNLQRYGVQNVATLKETIQKAKKTSLERYGEEHYSKTKEYAERVKRINLERYGVPVYMQSEECKEKVKKHFEDTYGVDNYSKTSEFKQKFQDTSLRKYGVPYTCMLSEARNFSNNSKPNNLFAKRLDNLHIEYEREFSLERYSYDFKINNYLVEINPFATHNSTWGLFKEENKKDKEYHLRKSQIAKENGFQCIHIWDWDNIDLVLDIISNKEKIYARKCIIKEISILETDKFLNAYHLQGSCKDQSIRLGLFYNNELIQVMTFGAPRYNKNFDFELLRLCTKSGFMVVGGANKLFEYFKKIYRFTSVISYCDNSKFSGLVYINMGFRLRHVGKPSKHWYNGKRHITNNLLNQRGADQLLGTKYGKGTSNREIMLDHKFVEIYDCGQSVYEYIK